MINNRPIIDNPFEEYLKNQHAEQYIGVDDDMPDDFDKWMSELDIEELIGYGNEFGKELLVLLDNSNNNESKSAELD